MDTTKYLIMKNANAIVNISREEDSITIISKQFDPSTGLAMDNDVSVISLSQIQGQIAYYQASQNNLNTIIADAQ